MQECVILLSFIKSMAPTRSIHVLYNREHSAQHWVVLSSAIFAHKQGLIEFTNNKLKHFALICRSSRYLPLYLS